MRLRTCTRGSHPLDPLQTPPLCPPPPTPPPPLCPLALPFAAVLQSKHCATWQNQKLLAALILHGRREGVRAKGGEGGGEGGLPLAVFADGRIHVALGGQLPMEPPTALFDKRLHDSTVTQPVGPQQIDVCTTWI